MPRALDIEVQIRWQLIEPDGSACTVCGDVCYLSMHRVCVSTGGGAFHEMKGLKGETFHSLCGSCYSAHIEDERIL